MPLITMTRPERAALRRLAKGALPASEIHQEYALKLVEHGLAVRETLRLKITAKGQLELLRQRYRNISKRAAAVEEQDFRTQLSPGLVGAATQRAGAPEPPERPSEG